MRNKVTILRTISGFVIAPILYILVWTLPVLNHSAFASWLVANTLFAYIVFFVLGGISHLTLMIMNTRTLWSYCGVIFIVSFACDLAWSHWSLSSYTSLYYAKSQVVEYGLITSAGYMLQGKEALTNGIVSSGVMAIFWLIAVYKPGDQVKHS